LSFDENFDFFLFFWFGVKTRLVDFIGAVIAEAEEVKEEAD